MGTYKRMGNGSGLGMKEENKLKRRALHGPIKCYKLKSIIDSILYRPKTKIKRGSRESGKKMMA